MLQKLRICTLHIFLHLILPENTVKFKYAYLYILQLRALRLSSQVRSQSKIIRKEIIQNLYLKLSEM